MNDGDTFLPPHFCENRGHEYQVSTILMPDGSSVAYPGDLFDLGVALWTYVLKAWTRETGVAA